MLGRIRRYLYRRNVKRIHKNYRMRNSESYHEIDEILKRFRTSGGLKHEYQSYKLYSLWHLLTTERPHRILELGSGTSTAIFAKYVRMHGGKLFSVDESSEWLENSRMLSSIDADDPRFILRQSDRRVLKKDGRPIEFSYDIEFEGEPFDLVLIDGPSMRLDGKRYKQAINPDIFDLVKKAPPELILVDIRAATVDAMIRRLKDLYEYELSDIITGDITPNYRYFSEFRFKS